MRTGRWPLFILPSLLAFIITASIPSSSISATPADGDTYQGPVHLIGQVGLGHPLQDSPAGQYRGVDLIFLIDQSGSMCGTRCYWQPGDWPVSGNDPLDQRFDGTRYALKLLGDYRANFAPGMGVRVSVLYFGTQVEMVLDWTELAAPGEDWNQQQQVLEELLDPNRYYDVGGSNSHERWWRSIGGYTDVLTAFERVKRQFDLAPALSPEDSPHLRVLVVLTDGMPRRPDGLSNEEHVRQVVEFARNYLPSPDYQIYVVAIDEGGTYWPRVEGIWQQATADSTHVGRVNGNEADVASRFSQIVDEIIAMIGAAGSGSGAWGMQIDFDDQGHSEVTVPPYTSWLRFRVYHNVPASGSTPTQVLHLVDPAGCRYEFANGQIWRVYPDGTREQALFHYNWSPSIEEWNLDTLGPELWGVWGLDLVEPNARVEVLLDIVYMTSEFDPPAQVYQYTMVPISVTLLASSGQSGGAVLGPVEEVNAYPLEVIAGITPISGGNTIVANLSSVGSGVYEGNVVLVDPGDYRVDFRARVLDGATGNPLRFPDGSEVVVLDTVADSRLSSSADNVITVLPISPQIPPVPPGASILEGESVPVEARFTDPSTGALIGNMSPDISMVSRMVADDGTVVSEVPMSDDGTGVFRGDLVGTQAGEYEVEVAAFGVDQGGAQVQIFQQSIGRVEVRPRHPVALSIVSPGAEEEECSGWPFDTAPMHIAVAAHDQLSGDPVDLVGLTGGEVPLSLSVVSSDGNEVAAGVMLQPGLATGVYEADVQVGLGTYTISVNGVGDLRPDYVFDPAVSHASLTVTRILPGYIPIALASLVGLFILVVAAIILYLNFKPPHAPATGILAIVAEWDDEDGRTQQEIVWECDLSERPQNTHVFGKRKDKLPGAIKKIKVTTHGEPQWSKNGTVEAWVWMESGERKGPIKLSPGRYSKPIYETREVTYFLAKDPSE